MRISLYNALDEELVEIASSLAVVPVAQDIRTLGGLTERALRVGQLGPDGGFTQAFRQQEHGAPAEVGIVRDRHGVAARMGGIVETLLL